MRILRIAKSIGIACILLVGSKAFCAPKSSTYKVKVNTASLIGHPAGPFSILFALTDGSGLGDGNNTVTIRDIDLGKGGASGNAVLFGGASGSLKKGVTLRDTSTLTLFSETFSPGNTLQFTVSLTMAADQGGVPDGFSFYILDSFGVPIPTLSPGADFLFSVDLSLSSPSAETFGADPSRSPSSGNPIAITLSFKHVVDD
jgi:hypothetical protein